MNKYKKENVETIAVKANDRNLLFLHPPILNISLQYIKPTLRNST